MFSLIKSEHNLTVFQIFIQINKFSTQLQTVLLEKQKSQKQKGISNTAQFVCLLRRYINQMKMWFSIYIKRI